MHPRQKTPTTRTRAVVVVLAPPAHGSVPFFIFASYPSHISRQLQDDMVFLFAIEVRALWLVQMDFADKTMPFATPNSLDDTDMASRDRERVPNSKWEAKSFSIRCDFFDLFFSRKTFTWFGLHPKVRRVQEHLIYFRMWFASKYSIWCWADLLVGRRRAKSMKKEKEKNARWCNTLSHRLSPFAFNIIKVIFARCDIAVAVFCLSLTTIAAKLKVYSFSHPMLSLPLRSACLNQDKTLAIRSMSLVQLHVRVNRAQVHSPTRHKRSAVEHIFVLYFHIFLFCIGDSVHCIDKKSCIVHMRKRSRMLPSMYVLVNEI